MATLKVYNKKQNVTYVFDNQPYWDKEKKQSRTKRKLIGKVDPETGETVPTGPRGRPRSSAGKDSRQTTQPDDPNLPAELEQARKRIKTLEKELSAARLKLGRYEAALKGLAGNMKDRCDFIGALLNGD